MVIYFHSLKKEYFTKTIFSGVRLKLNINAHEKIGIIGKNGEGKTTLLRLIAGIEEKDGGAIKIEPKKTKVFYLSIDFIDSQRDLYAEDFLLKINSYLFDLKEQLKILESKLKTKEGVEQYGEVLEKFEKVGGYEWEKKIEKVLKDLKLTGKQIKSLSGGEKSRLILASIKMIDADLILLDEPTNHLDIKGLEDLEKFLLTDKKSYIIVSHDQKFLDNIVTTILSIEKTRVKVYPGNYSAYKKQKEAEDSQKSKEYSTFIHEKNRLQNLASDIEKRSEEGITKVVSDLSRAKKKRFTNAQGKSAKVASDRDKMSAHYFNQKLESKRHGAVIVKRRIDRLKRIDKPKRDWGIKVNLPLSDATADFILRTKAVSIELGSKRFEFPDISILNHEKIALIGPNGIGKSTYVKILAGILNDYSGQVSIPESVNIGYYSQTHEGLKLDNTVLENLLNVEIIKDLNTPAVVDARNFLHQFLFTGDQPLQKVRDLSQGEKSKLALAKIIYSNVNFLILDEPTNHLDIPSKERVESALNTYKGTLLTVSHDRYFLESIGVNRYIELS